MKIVSALSVWSLCATQRLVRLVLWWIVPSMITSITDGGSVDAGYDCPHRNLQSGALRVSALALLTVIAPVTQAVAQHGGSDLTGLTEDLTKLSPELAGGRWGWRLTRYPDVGYSIKIAGRVYLVLSTDPKKNENIIWDPLTGLGRDIDHAQWASLIEEHRQDSSTGILFLGQFKAIPNNRTLRYEPAPGVGMPSCSPNFYGYFAVHDSSQKLLRSFYVVVKISDPLSVRYHICIEGSGGYEMVKPRVTIDFESEQIWSYALADGTLLFVTGDKYGTTIVRLDDNLQQHTSVDGRVFVLNAADINAGLESLADIQDPTSRFQVFLAAIAAARKSGFH